MVEAPSCSLVINTYDRGRYLERLLPSLRHLLYERLEVVIVNGPSTDHTTSVVEALAPDAKLVQCPAANLSVSRNLGIAAAAGDLVAFLDDDALPAEREWIRHLTEPFVNDPDQRLGAVGGAIFAGDSDEYEFNGGLTSDYGFQVFRFEDERREDGCSRRWVRGVPGGNCAFRRRALEAAGGFDEHFVYYLDEADVCLRLARLGYEIAHVADAPIRHYPARAGDRAALLRNRRQATRSDTYFCLKNGEDSRWRRLLKTLRAAPRKHFVREMQTLRQAGHIPERVYRQFWREWLLGLGEGGWNGIFKERRLWSRAGDPPAFVPFGTHRAPGRLTICLSSQVVPPDPRLGGVGRYTYALARGLHELGHEVHVVARSETRLRHDGLGFVVHGISFEDLNVGSPRFAGRPVLTKNVQYALAVWARIQQLRGAGSVPDLLHCSNWDLEGLAVILSGDLPVALLLVSSLATIIETEGWIADRDLAACLGLDKWQIEKAARLLCPSTGVLEAYRTHVGVRADRVAEAVRVALGIAPDLRPPPPPSVADLSKRLLFVGRLEKRKGAHILLEVLPDLLQRFAEWQVDLVGNHAVPIDGGPPLRDSFLAKHRGAGWLDRVVFHGTVPDGELLEFYRKCDLFVAPSLYESFGLIYLEAMQYAKAVVGCRTGGIPEVVSDGVDGVLVRPGDASDLLAALEKLMSDTALRDRLGRSGQQRVRESMNHRVMAIQFAREYRAMLDAWRRQHAEHAAINEVNLLFDKCRVARHGEWDDVEANGAPHLRAIHPDAWIELRAEQGAEVQIVALRHSRSGLLEIRLGDAEPTYLDLYSEELAPSDVYRLRLPVGDEVSVRLRVHRERNPLSHGHEVLIRWISVRSRSPIMDDMLEPH